MKITKSWKTFLHLCLELCLGHVSVSSAHKQIREPGHRFSILQFRPYLTKWMCVYATDARFKSTLNFLAVVKVVVVAVWTDCRECFEERKDQEVQTQSMVLVYRSRIQGC